MKRGAPALPALLTASLLWGTAVPHAPAAEEDERTPSSGAAELQAPAPDEPGKAEKELMARLGRFTRKDVGQTFDEKILTDGHSGTRKPKTLLGFRRFPGRGQHIYLFKTENRVYALAWVEKGGTPLEIPDVAEGSPLEDALNFSGDSLTETGVPPGEGVVILQGATEAWLKALKE